MLRTPFLERVKPQLDQYKGISFSFSVLPCAHLIYISSSRAAKKRSAAWTHVSLLSSSPILCCCSAVYTICMLCTRSRKDINSCGNTTNLFKHIKKKQEKEITELQQRRKGKERKASSAFRPPTRRQGSPAESFQRAKEYPGKYSEINVLVKQFNTSKYEVHWNVRSKCII